MAIMINCARDWTYDLYIRDVKAYGMEDRSNGKDYNAYFVAYLKRAAARFSENWKSAGKAYGHEYVGDAFARRMMDWFSDFYKDTYGQRPHLPIWFYVHPLGLPMQEDTARMFCAKPVDRAVQDARAVRENI